ncbi:MAG: DNA-methyltransferase [Planctomycetota bacterium]|jgi:site-specific DNA-methyltransferase (adenine-specific)
MITASAHSTWELICVDVSDGLASVRNPARLIFADPPYNIGIDYGSGKQADQLPADAFLDWCKRWLAACADVLTDDGSLWVVISDEWADHFGVMLTSLGLHRRNWIKWYETFGVNCTRKFNRCSRHIFYCVKDPGWFVFNPDAVRRPSDRQMKYGDKRANPSGKVHDDVWVVPRVAGTHGERIRELPTQLPLEITRRIVGAASNRGDLVLEPFCGGAPAGVAAVQSGRRYLGIDSSPEFVEVARRRLEELPFTLTGEHHVKPRTN